MISCEVRNIPDKVSWFKDTNTSLPKLRVLDLRHNLWFGNHSIMAMCKIQELEELNLRGCVRMGECFAYTALATRFGFLELKRVDLRDTFTSNADVPCWGRLSKLTHLWLGKTAADVELTRPPSCEGDGKVSDRGLLSLCVFGSDPNTPVHIEHLVLAHTEVRNLLYFIFNSFTFTMYVFHSF